MADEALYPYPPGTPGSTQSGFYHLLNEQQKDALLEIQKWVIKSDVDMAQLASATIHPTLTLLRYLRANNFDTEKAIKHIEANIAYRVEMKVDELITKTPEEILGCSMEKLMEVFPHWQCGYDKTGRPVLYKQYAKFDVTAIKKMTTIDAIMKYHIWEQEACLRLCVEQSHKRGQIVETCSAVVDVKDMKLSQVTREFINLTKSIADIDKDKYPETLGKLFIINVPTIFPLVWRTVQVFLDPAVAAKIEIHGSRDSWFPAISNFIGVDNLPNTYGGNLPSLSKDIHPYAETMRSFFAERAVEPKDSSVSGASLDSVHGEEEEVKVMKEEEKFEEVPCEGHALTEEGGSAHKETRVLRKDDDENGEMEPEQKSRWQVFSGFFRLWRRDRPLKTEEQEGKELEQVKERNNDASRLPPGGRRTSDRAQIGLRQRNRLSRTSSGIIHQHGETANNEYIGWADELQYIHDLEESGGQGLGSRRADRDNEDGDKNHHRRRPSLGTTTKGKLGSSGMKLTNFAGMDDLGSNAFVKFFGLDRSQTFLCFLECLCLVWMGAWLLVKSIFRCLTLEMFLGRKTLKEIRRSLYYAIWLYTAAAITAMVLSAIVVSSSHWISSLARIQLWTGVVILFVSCLMILLNFAAFMGCYYQNRSLLIMYICCLSAAMFVFGIVAIACFLYADVPRVTALGNKAIESAFDKENSADAQAAINKYNKALGAGCVIGFALSMLPLTLSANLARRLGKIQEQKLRSHQLRVVLKVAQSITITASLVMLAYGASSLKYLFSIGFSSTAFDLYGLIYGGVTVLIVSIGGLWVSETAHKRVVFWFYALVLPLLILLLLIAAVISLSHISSSQRHVAEKFDESGNVDAVTLHVQTQLLVSGVMCCFVCLFQICSVVAARSLHRAMLQDEVENYGWLYGSGSGSSNGNKLTMQKLRQRDALLLGLHTQNLSGQKVLGKLHFENRPRERGERLIMLWAVVMAVYHIYFNGTYAIFSFVMDDKTASDGYGRYYWMNKVWVLMGNYDSRYTNTDDFLVCADAILAVVVGPLLLFFAWATFVRAPHRHVLGIVATLLEIHTQVLYYAIEIHAGLSDFSHRRDWQGAFAAMIILSVIFCVTLPLLVLVREITITIRGISKADTQQLLLTAMMGDRESHSLHSPAHGLSSNPLAAFRDPFHLSSHLNRFLSAHVRAKIMSSSSSSDEPAFISSSVPFRNARPDDPHRPRQLRPRLDENDVDDSVSDGGGQYIGDHHEYDDSNLLRRAARAMSMHTNAPPSPPNYSERFLSSASVTPITARYDVAASSSFAGSVSDAGASSQNPTEKSTAVVSTKDGDVKPMLASTSQNWWPPLYTFLSLFMNVYGLLRFLRVDERKGDTRQNEHMKRDEAGDKKKQDEELLPTYSVTVNHNGKDVGYPRVTRRNRPSAYASSLPDTSPLSTSTTPTSRDKAAEMRMEARVKHLKWSRVASSAMKPRSRSSLAIERQRHVKIDTVARSKVIGRNNEVEEVEETLKVDIGKRPNYHRDIFLVDEEVKVDEQVSSSIPGSSFPQPTTQSSEEDIRPDEVSTGDIATNEARVENIVSPQKDETASTAAHESQTPRRGLSNLSSTRSDGQNYLDEQITPSSLRVHQSNLSASKKRRTIDLISTFGSGKSKRRGPPSVPPPLPVSTILRMGTNPISYRGGSYIDSSPGSINQAEGNVSGRRGSIESASVASGPSRSGVTSGWTPRGRRNQSGEQTRQSHSRPRMNGLGLPAPVAAEAVLSALALTEDDKSSSSLAMVI